MKQLITKIKTNLCSFPKILTLLWGAAPQTLCLILVLSSASGLLTPLNLYCSRNFLDSIVLIVTSNGSIQSVAFWLMLLLGITFFSNLLSIFVQTKRANFSDDLSIHIIGKTLDKYTNITAEEFERKGVYDKLHMAMTETPNRCGLYVDMVSSIIKSFVSLIGVIAILAVFDLKIILILFFIYLPLLKFKTILSTRKYSLYNKQAEGHRLCDSLTAILLNATNVPELKILNSGAFIKENIETLQRFQNNELQKERGKVLRADAMSFGIASLATFCVKMWIIFVALIQQQTVGSIYQLLSAADSLQTLLQSVIAQVSSGYEQSLYVNNLFELWSLPDENDNSQEELLSPITEISFENVSFIYPGSTTYAIKNINITFTAGNMYSIVGTNGSGKSTLIKLLLGLYNPTSGSILVNGKPIRTWRPSSLRHQIAAIFQNPIHYPFDVATNIKLGSKSKAVNAAAIHCAAQKAQADIFIQQLPGKYETQLCKEWKNGVDLSGGQWQKIALSRFLLRQSPLRILDEPFSAIDSIAERQIMKEVTQNHQNAITILITHKYDMIKDFNNIVVMENGGIIATGDYKTLINESELFRQLLQTKQRKSTEDERK